MRARLAGQGEILGRVRNPASRGDSGLGILGTRNGEPESVAVGRSFPPMTPRARRALFTVVLFFSVCAVVGSLLQRRVGAQSSQDESQLRDNLKSFTKIYALVVQR